jgi:hypothetical protein
MIDNWIPIPYKSMDKNMDKHLVVQALLMAVCQRRLKHEVLVHGDQGPALAG